MSNIGQGLTAVVGGVVGFALGGPMGAAYGFQIGLLGGSLLFPTQLPHVYGPKITDLATTQAQLGGPIPITYGTIAVPGSVIYLGCVEERTTEEDVGGKGGPEQTITTYTYYQTIALGLCEGSIDGVLRIWENGELKYDARLQQEDETDDQYTARITANSDYSSSFEVYLGGETQLADPTMEIEMGVDNVPAFRGLAYIVYPNRQLRDDQARRHPQWRFEVYRAPGQREVVYPTNLDDSIATEWENNQIVPDWAHNRYYTIDDQGGDDRTIIRTYSIIDNTEISQESIPNELFNGLTVGPDGDLYLSYFIDGNVVKLTGTDGRVAIFDGVLPAFHSSFYSAIVVRVYGTLANHDFIFTTLKVSDGVMVFDLEADTFLPITVESSDGEETMICMGAVDKISKRSYAWALSWDVGDTEIIIRRYTFRQTIETDAITGMIVYDYTAEADATESTIAATDIDASWDDVTNVSGLVYDQSDGTLIFGASSGASTGRILKWRPPSSVTLPTGTVNIPGVILWQTEGQEDLINNDRNYPLTRLTGDTIAMMIDVEHIAVINTQTGEWEDQDWGDDLSDTHEVTQVYDSALNAIITFIQDEGPTVIFLDRRQPGSVSLAEIVSDVCDRCDLESDDIDVVDLEERFVLGYAITRPMPGRGAIEPLRQVGFFDGVESEGVLHFPTRGKDPVRTLTAIELGAHESGADFPPAVTTNKTDDVDLPLRIRMKYIAPSRDYEPGEALSPTRFTSRSVNEIDIEVPIAITDDMAVQSAEIIWADAWAGRWQHEIALDIEFLALDPADCIEVPVDGRLYRARIDSIGDASGGLLRKLNLIRDQAESYASSAVADPPILPVQTIVVYGATTLILLDLPPLRDEDDNAGIYAAAYRTDPNKAWSGAVIHRSIDSGASYTPYLSTSVESTVGRLVEALPSGITETWDNEHEIVLDVLSGAGGFDSRNEEAVLNGGNALAVGADGRWEIVQFLNAAWETATRIRLTGLLRGRRGTEHNRGSHQVGDTVVLLTAFNGIVRLPLQTSEIGATRYYKAVSVGTTPSSAGAQSFIGTGEALEPFSPVQIEGARDLVTGDLTITWIRRGRIGQELPGGADIPLSEESESYEVDVINLAGSPSTVARTLTSATQSVVYTAAQQTTDFGGLQSSVLVNVYQLSATVGRGAAGEATI